MTEKQGLEHRLRRAGRFLLISTVVGMLALLLIVFLRSELTIEALFFVGIWLIWAVFMLTRSDMLRRH